VAQTVGLSSHSPGFPFARRHVERVIERSVFALWDKQIQDNPGTVRLRRRNPLTARELEHLRLIRGFFAYRTWDVAGSAPRAPRLPLTAAEITQRYGAPDDANHNHGT
jgi:hypothetical protein